MKDISQVVVSLWRISHRNLRMHSAFTIEEMNLSATTKEVSQPYQSVVSLWQNYAESSVFSP